MSSARMQALPGRLALALAALALLWGRAGAAPASQAGPPAAHEQPVTLDLALTVSDLKRSVAFFCEVLDFQLLHQSEQVGPAHEALEGIFAGRAQSARLRLGAEEIELIEWLTPESQPYPAQSRSNDRWFQHIAIVVSDMETAYNRLRTHGVKHISSGPQRLPDWNPNAGGIEAFYFRDPDQHALELIAFPAGKGDGRWQREHSQGRLFLGIDHTAIGVASSAQSLRFWRDLLGFPIAGTSENYGLEQAQLNAVPGAHLQITGLRALSGPGIEFLEYQNPLDGRPYPTTARPCDLVHWETRVFVPDLDRVAAKLLAYGGSFISKAPVEFAGQRRLLVRDPDGHAVELVSSLHPTAQDPR